MPSRLLSLVAVVSLLAPGALLRADDRPKHAPAEGAAKAPTIVVRIKPISELLSDGKYVATIAGQEEQANQAEGLVAAMTGENGLGGIDLKRPLGVYGSISPDLVSSGGVVLVPIADEKTLIDFLEGYTIKAEKGDDGIYTLKSSFPIPVPIFLRFANKYAYVTAQNKAALDKSRLLDPDTVLSSVRPATVSARFRIDQIPEFAKQMALAQMEAQTELRMAEEQEKKGAGESKAQAALRRQVIKSVSERVVSVLKEGGEVEAFFDVDRKANQIVFEMALAGKPGSTLSRAFAEIGHSQSLFAGLAGDHAALNVVLHFALPEELRKGFEQVIHEGMQKGLEKEKDEARRESGKKLLKALEPTIKAGELDVAVTLRGPSDSKHYTVIVGVKVKDGQAIEAAVHEVLKSLPESQREKIKLNAETAGDIKIHRIDGQKDFDEQHRQIFGDNPFFAAIRSDSIIVAGGERGLEALKNALTIEPRTSAPVVVEVSVASLAPFAAHGEKKALAELHKAAESSFKGDKDSDKVRFTLEGGKALKARFAMDAAVVKFISIVSQNQTLKDLHGSARPAKKPAKKAADDE
jgi:hypothetical protein